MLIKIAKVVVDLVPESAGFSIVRTLAARTQPLPVAPFEKEAMLQASKLLYGQNNQNVAWAWGKGPVVIFVHGWGGRAAQMAPLALHVAKLGFRSVALDVTGHGDSPEQNTSWGDFLRDIADVSRAENEQIFAYVAHSAGALSMMAARNSKGVRAQRYICISAPSYPFPPISVIQKKLNPKEGVMNRYKQYIAEQFDSTWEKLQEGSSYTNAGSDLLLFYDETDRFVNHTEGDRIKALCPGARLIKTNAYSHQDILSAPELVEATTEFLKDKSQNAI